MACEFGIVFRHSVGDKVRWNDTSGMEETVCEHCGVGGWSPIEVVRSGEVFEIQANIDSAGPEITYLVTTAHGPYRLVEGRTEWVDLAQESQ